MSKRFIPYVLLVVLTMVLTTLFQPLSHIPALAQQQPGCQTFKESPGKTLCGKFLTYWQSHGALAQQGFPLSNEFAEVSDLNGKPYTVQYFERAVFELHPENAGTAYEVLLSQLGTFRFKAKYPNGEPGAPPQATPGPQEPLGMGSTVTVRDGLTITLLDQAPSGIRPTGIQNDNCGGTVMAWSFQIENKSKIGYAVNVDSATQLDSMGNKYQPAGCGNNGREQGFYSQYGLAAGSTVKGSVVFSLKNLPSAVIAPTN